MKEETEMLASGERSPLPFFHVTLGTGMPDPMQVNDELFPEEISELLGNAIIAAGPERVYEYS